MCFQTLVFDLKGQPVREQDELNILVKDWERIGRNRSVSKFNWTCFYLYDYDIAVYDYYDYWYIRPIRAKM